MFNKMVVSAMILLLVPFTFLPICLGAQDTITVQSGGVGDIHTGRKAKARDAAIDDALRRAVEQAVGMFLHAETLVQNGDIVKDAIYSRSKGYVRKYAILKETSDAAQFHVRIEADVSTGKLRDDLAAIGLLMNRKHKPRIMVVIPEYHINGIVPDPTGETEIVKKLLEKEFKVVDPSQVAAIRYNDRVTAALKGNSSLAAAIGLAHGAEVIIIGEAFSEHAGSILGEMDSCRARIEARAVRIDTGEIIAAGSEQAAGLDITRSLAAKKALQKAGGELGGHLVEQILCKWSRDVTDMTSIELVVNGLNYNQLLDFRSVLLESVRGIKAIHQRTFTNNRAVMDIDMKGDAEILSEELSNTHFKNYKIQVTEFSINRLIISVNM